jgi:hypothetical protein
MIRHFVTPLHVRQLQARMQFQQPLKLGETGMFLASGCLDAPELSTMQWNADTQDWRFFAVRSDEVA